jgi:hypothetical protein
MVDIVPKLDREKLLQELLSEAERTVNEVADAVDDAPAGRLIRDSEEPARDALDRFRKLVYERVLQAKIDAAEAAFPPSDERGDRPAQTSQREAGFQRADDQRTRSSAACTLALPGGGERDADRQAVGSSRVDD